MKNASTALHSIESQKELDFLTRDLAVSICSACKRRSTETDEHACVPEGEIFLAIRTALWEGDINGTDDAIAIVNKIERTRNEQRQKKQQARPV